MPRNDRPFLSLHKKLLTLDYENEWQEYSNNSHVNEILSHASKKIPIKMDTLILFMLIKIKK